MMPFKKTVRNQVFGRFLCTCSTLPSGIHSTQSSRVFPHEFERSCRNPEGIRPSQHFSSPSSVFFMWYGNADRKSELECI